MEVRSLFGAWLLLPLALYGLWRLARERRDLARCLLTVFVVCSVVTYLTLGRKAAYGPEWTRYLSPAFFPVLFALAVGAASLPARTLSPLAALAALVVFGGGAGRALLEKKRRGPLSYEVVASGWWKRHRPDGVVVVGSDAHRVSHNLIRLLPDSAPLYTSVNGRDPFFRWERDAGRWGMGDLLVRPSAGRPSSGTYLVVAGTGAKAPRICDTLPGAERIAASPARLSLCQIP